MGRRRRSIRWAVGVGTLVWMLTGCGQKAPTERVVPLGTVLHQSTRWAYQSDVNLDALAFLNVLTGDEYFTVWYPSEYAHFEPLLKESERAAIGELTSLLLGQLGVVPSTVFLAMYDRFGYRSLSEFRADLADAKRFRQSHQEALDEFSQKSLDGRTIPDSVLEPVLRDLGTMIGFLDRTGFVEYWNQYCRPVVQGRIVEWTAQTASVNLVPLVENLLGGGLESDQIRTTVVFFCMPYGMELTGAAQIEAPAIDTATFVGNTAHELLHGHIDWIGDPEMVRLVDLVSQDPTFKNAFEHRPRVANYNTPLRLVEEDLTRALDQVVGESLGVAMDPVERWVVGDGGLHVLANALVLQFHRDGRTAEERRGSIRDYLATLVKAGTLGDRFVTDAFQTTYGSEGPNAFRIRGLKRAGDLELASWSPEYRKVMADGDFLILLQDVFTASGAQASLALLEDQVGRRGRELWLTCVGDALRARYLYAGNWSTLWLGRTVYYRNALYFRIDEADRPRYRPEETYQVSGGSWKFTAEQTLSPLETTWKGF